MVRDVFDEMSTLLDHISLAPTKLLFAAALGFFSLAFFIFFMRKSDDFKVPLIPRDLKLFFGVCLGLFSVGFLLGHFLDKWR